MLSYEEALAAYITKHTEGVPDAGTPHCHVYQRSDNGEDSLLITWKENGKANTKAITCSLTSFMKTWQAVNLYDAALERVAHTPLARGIPAQNQQGQESNNGRESAPIHCQGRSRR